MAERTEMLLQENCNLIIKGTHQVVRREDGIFVADKDLQFPFSVERAMTQAMDTAQSSHDAEDGCINCVLFDRCKPIPSMMSETGVDVLVPAQRTSFESSEEER